MQPNCGDHRNPDAGIKRTSPHSHKSIRIDLMHDNTHDNTQANTNRRVTIINQLIRDDEAERERLLAGLRAPHATIEPKYFYDECGCAIYGAICLSDEYYPTRTEAAIFDRCRDEIAAAVGQGGTFIDVGAGDCAKAMKWFDALRPSRYVPVDIAAPSMATAMQKIAREHATMDLVGVVTDFSQSLNIPAELSTGRTTVFYPGSSIGNFTPSDAVRFLRQMREIAAPDGGLLIGVDSKKDKAILDRAYDDALGITAAFNLNALRHINRVLDADFDVGNWKHVGFYNADMGRIEMHLESRVDQTVNLDGVARVYARGEKIHSENSYKYHREEFDALLREAGFSDIRCWSNEANAFWVFYAKA
jgi:dimethylhistidine N-methyltransferase